MENIQNEIKTKSQDITLLRKQLASELSLEVRTFANYLHQQMTTLIKKLQLVLSEKNELQFALSKMEHSFREQLETYDNELMNER